MKPRRFGQARVARVRRALRPGKRRVGRGTPRAPPRGRALILRVSRPAAGSFVTLWARQVAPMATARSAFGAGVADGCILAIGGSDGQARRALPPPTAPATAPHHTGCDALAPQHLTLWSPCPLRTNRTRRVLHPVLMRRLPTDASYHPSSHHPSPPAPAPPAPPPGAARRGRDADGARGRLRAQVSQRSVEKYDPAADAWLPAAGMTTRRENHAVAVSARAPRPPASPAPR